MLFEAGLLWDNCGRWGEKDCRAVITYVRGRGSREQLEKARAELYHPFKGFAAGIIAMLIPAVLTVVCTALAFNGWEKHCASLADTLYNILYMLFMAASPLLLSGGWREARGAAVPLCVLPPSAPTLRFRDGGPDAPRSRTPRR